MKGTFVGKGLVLATILASSPLLAKTTLPSYWDSYLSIGGYYFSERPRTAGVINAFLPVHGAQSASSLYYIDIRGLDKTGPSWEGNLGIGYRQFNQIKQCLGGLYVFYDHQRSENRHYFSQITLGGEYWRQKWFVGGNAYIPVGQTVIDDSSLNATQIQTNGAYRNIYFGKGQDVALYGVDLEVGYEWQPGIIGYLGGYYFDRSGFDSVKGSLARVEYHYKDYMGKRLLGVLDDLRLFAQIQHDEPRGTRFYVGAQVRFTLGRAHKVLHGVARHMADPALRDVDLVSVPTHKAFEPLTDSTGRVINVRDVYNEADLDTALIDAYTDIIAVHGIIVDGDIKELAVGQVITGGRHIFTRDGQTFTVILSDGGALDAFDAETSVLELTTDNTVRDLTLRADSELGTNVIEVADLDVALGHLTIDSVVGNAFIYLRQGINTDAIITITNNTIDMGTADVEGYGVSIDVQEGASIEAFVNNNTIKSQSNDAGGILLSVDGGEIDLPNGLHDNTIDVGDDGVDIDSRNDGSITIYGFYGNTINAGNDGIDIDSDDSGSMTIDGFYGNTIDVGDDGVDIYSYSDGSITIDGFYGNTINAGNDGIDIDSDDSGSMTIDGFYGNTIDVGNNGVYINSDNDGSITIYGFHDNTIDVGDDGVDINSDNDGSVTIDGFHGNTIDASYDGIDIDLHNDGSVMIDGFYSNTITAVDDGINFYVASGASIVFNSGIYNNILNGDRAVRLGGSAEGSVMIADFYGNTLTGSSDYTMVVEPENEATIYIEKFYNNTFIGAGSADILLKTADEGGGSISITVAHPASESITLSEANTGTGEGGDVTVERDEGAGSIVIIPDEED